MNKKNYFLISQKNEKNKNFLKLQKNLILE